MASLCFMRATAAAITGADVPAKWAAAEYETSDADGPQGAEKRAHGSDWRLVAYPGAGANKRDPPVTAAWAIETYAGDGADGAVP
ncbi:hypothetical protein GLOTRDRAFT_128236 [Gloeophyllum trabeum ATCC 11539]|uniref:Uncharacterized protein n=1 Tax=Gloeophyllum trabeum (strain ATCC 11539 / FP-39264 / Madison 617) TaxID=670483 RepID=S7Q9T9_GLOTA|nr:uncharacterized protein GLOTRDRAFT_128236 [Gloeophyllum trabeum ATCC 11539]EPQ56287.1 hypothetical protein GLOTRDRAFT_128236 [Gloeophyllum trabeum ATCC 11539]